jgi:uncharacterized protein YqjF (DUF2071 family)
MAQVWHDLLFAHWPVAVDELRGHVPPQLTLDTFDGSGWVGVVPFRMSGIRPRRLPALPWLSVFPELNVRTYVTVGGISGVYFFSLDASNAVAVALGRAIFKLPYFWASMSLRMVDDAVVYASQRTHVGAPAAELRARYRPTGPVFAAPVGSLEWWLTERYSLYTVDALGRAVRTGIHHPRWPLQPAEAVFARNTMAAAHGIALPPIAPLLHFARRQDVIVWPPRRVTGQVRPASLARGVRQAGAQQSTASM